MTMACIHCHSSSGTFASSSRGKARKRFEFVPRTLNRKTKTKRGSSTETAVRAEKLLLLLLLLCPTCTIAEQQNVLEEKFEGDEDFDNKVASLSLLIDSRHSAWKKVRAGRWCVVLSLTSLYPKYSLLSVRKQAQTSQESKSSLVHLVVLYTVELY